MEDSVAELVHIEGTNFQFKMNQEIGAYSFVSDALISSGLLEDPYLWILMDGIGFVINEELTVKIVREDYEQLSEFFRTVDETSRVWPNTLD
ncbi:hypothetical protein [Neptuniibacter sp.]|uniref:hypothetical protein n=1 Tax=Neptuniibacter sp. TaxID=1962643 RepID=UPI003B59975D